MSSDILDTFSLGSFTVCLDATRILFPDHKIQSSYLTAYMSAGKYFLCTVFIFKFCSQISVNGFLLGPIFVCVCVRVYTRVRIYLTKQGVAGLVSSLSYTYFSTFRTAVRPSQTAVRPSQIWQENVDFSPMDKQGRIQ